MATLQIGPLPTEQTLESLYRNGVRRLINVSGVDLRALYPHFPDRWRDVALAQFGFVDVFSRSPPLADAALTEAAGRICADDYTVVADPDQRAQFLAAVDALCGAIAADRATYIFCHRGIGRSPAVTAAALARRLRDDLPRACRQTRTLAPRAHFSRVTLGALRWSLDAGPVRPSSP